MNVRKISIILVLLISGELLASEGNSLPQTKPQPLQDQPAEVSSQKRSVLSIKDLLEIPGDVLSKPSQNPIDHDNPPFFTYAPNSFFKSLQFQETTNPSTRVNIARYAKNPVGNQRQYVTEVPGLLVNPSYGSYDTTFTSTYNGSTVVYYMDGIPLSRQPKSEADFNFLPDVNNIERIDFYNNASTVLGRKGNASVNFVTKNPTLDTPFRFTTLHTLGSRNILIQTQMAMLLALEQELPVIFRPLWYGIIT